MKRFLAILAAMALLFAAVPALAFTGFDSDPGAPEVTAVENALFDYSITRVENDPETSENDWGEVVYTWIPMANDAPVAAGDTVTLLVEITVPENIEGFTAEELEQIELFVVFEGLSDIEIVTAVGADANYDCDYDAGVCFPLDGYGNIELDEDSVTILPHLNSTMQVVVRGVAEGASINCVANTIVGQFGLPTHFSVGKLDVTDDCAYYVYFKDIFNVQIRGMKFYAEDGLFTHYYVCLNNHDYIRSEDGSSFTSVEDPSVVITEGVKFEALTLAYETYMNFFGFEDDGVNDVLTVGVLLNGANPKCCENTIVIGSEGDEPVDPTDPPVNPTPVTPPQTGAVSLAVIGVIALASGAGVVLFRRKK